MSNAQQQVYAGFWRRVAAYVVDSLVMFIPAAIVSFALGRDSWLAALVQVAMWLLYKAGMEASARQATIGKQALGIKVTGYDGGRISFARAIGRYFGLMLSGIILCIGYAMAAFTKRRQALHDMICSTLVVRAGASPEEVLAGGRTMPMTAGVWIAVVFFAFIPILGILAAVSIPAYQDYVARAKMMEVINEARAREPEVADELRAGGAEREIIPTSPYVKRIIVRPSDRSLVMMVDAAKVGRPATDGSSIRFHLEADGSWTCAGSGVRKQHLPASCRL